MKNPFRIFTACTKANEITASGTKSVPVAAVYGRRLVCPSLNSALLLFALASLTFASCNGANNKSEESKPEVTSIVHHGRPHTMSDTGGNYQFIPIDSANKMLTSYLASISAPANDSTLYSLIVNADSLRTYLNDTSIHNMKLMFAHTLSYINNGGQGHPCGYSATDLTIIIAGYNSAGNYVYYVPATGVREVMDHSIPCPTNCPVIGTASSNTLQ